MHSRLSDKSSRRRQRRQNARDGAGERRGWATVRCSANSGMTSSWRQSSYICVSLSAAAWKRLPTWRYRYNEFTTASLICPFTSGDSSSSKAWVPQYTNLPSRLHLDDSITAVCSALQLKAYTVLRLHRTHIHCRLLCGHFFNSNFWDCSVETNNAVN